MTILERIDLWMETGTPDEARELLNDAYGEIRRLLAQYEPEGSTCEHGVPDIYWCDDCRVERIKAEEEYKSGGAE